MNIAIILASGKGRRIQKDKVLLELNKKPIIAYSMQAFEENDSVDKIFVVCKEDKEKEIGDLAKKLNISKFEKFIQGAGTRRQSGLNALNHILENEGDFKESDSVVLFHNAANPFVTQSEISTCIKEAKGAGACAVGHQFGGVMKIVSKEGFVKKTLKKRALRVIQTPQAMTLRIAKEAFERARKFKVKTTDDASLVEKAGRRVKIIPASDFNIEIATPLDLELAEIIAKKQK